MKKSLSLLLMLLALGAGGHAFAAEPVPVAAVNLGFDKWENGAPAGWNARPTGYKASSDCDAGRGARCVLRLSSTDAYTRGGFFPVAQRIAWAHNFHISYQQAPTRPKSMGNYVAERRKAEAYTVGLFMGRGAAAKNNHARYEILAPAAGTFDAVMSNGGARYAFVDFSTARPAPETSWIFAPIVMRSWGETAATLTPVLGYDGVLYIDAVTPPEYR